ncbi:MAG: hypothetical protein HY074_00415 [Deltaproteobacteria bacterium]|nr:hypothetical protein [Deltaproteobacteria bacterium]
MKTLMLLVATMAFAQQGIMPGEPDPNKSPHTDHERPGDANKKCPEGLLAVPQMECANPAKPKKLDCKKPVVATKCAKRPIILMCKKPLKPMKSFVCE